MIPGNLPLNQAVSCPEEGGSCLAARAPPATSTLQPRLLAWATCDLCLWKCGYGKGPIQSRCCQVQVELPVAGTDFWVLRIPHCTDLHRTSGCESAQGQSTEASCVSGPLVTYHRGFQLCSRLCPSPAPLAGRRAGVEESGQPLSPAWTWLAQIQNPKRTVTRLPGPHDTIWTTPL